MKPLILGIGNILLGDEGIGVRIAQQLEENLAITAEFDVVDGGTCGMELLDLMANRQHIIVIDAVLANKAPGEIITLYDEQVPTFFSRKISPHQLGLCDVLSALKLTDEFPSHLCLIGIQPETLEPQMTLSQTVQNAFPAIFTALRQAATSYGLNFNQ